VTADRTGQAELARIRQLADELARIDTGPAAELATALAEAVLELTARVDALWQLIATVVESAGLTAAAPAAPAMPAPAIAGRPGRAGESSASPPEFAEALRSARAAGRRGIRLTIDGREWVAALSKPDTAADDSAWAALERLARDAGDQDEI
jgi:hypothetical protein